MMIWLCQRSFLSVSLFLLCNVARLGVLVVFFDLLCDLCKVVEKLKKSTDSVFSGFFLTGRGCGRPPPRLPETLRRSTEVYGGSPPKVQISTEVYGGLRSFSRSFCTFRLSQNPALRRSTKVYGGLRRFPSKRPNSTKVYGGLRRSTEVPETFWLSRHCFSCFCSFSFLKVPLGSILQHVFPF